ncbi:glycerophosphoryl diester phosphodiesterase membrane domain-containing protein [Synechococcus sp. H70.1]|uniref:glycerophosphoryl diester phosphodiesterase membrane domain-containing protein n=1 Tax=Synechococcus sp. H70.1 TaxID=2964527 RepID=UPI0039C60364
MQSATLNPFSLLQRSFEVVGPIYGLLVILASPGFIIPVVAGLIPRFGGILNLAYILIVAPILAGAAFWLVDQHLKRQAPLLGNSLDRALAKAVPLVFGSILAELLSFLASLLLILPGIYVGVRLVFTPCAIALENRGATEGLRYSWNLVKGRWWGVFWALLVVSGLILAVVFFVVFAGVLGSILGFDGTVLGLVLWVVGGVAVTPLAWTYIVLLFRSLQHLKGQAA